jgi:hypothetical protein
MVGRHFVDRDQLLLMAGLLPLLLRNPLRNDDSGFFRQVTDGLRIGHLADFHQKSKNITPFAATETVKHLAVRCDGKRGRFFLVKRTKADKIPPRLFQRNIF